MCGKYPFILKQGAVANKYNCILYAAASTEILANFYRGVHPQLEIQYVQKYV
jgi:hypothetical protein